MNTKDQGDISEAKLLSRLIAGGYGVAIPFGDNKRYDLILDKDDTLFKVQIKTGRINGGAIEFPTSSSYRGNKTQGYSRKSYVGEIDYFGIYCLENDGTYLVPIEDCGVRQGSLRLVPTRNGQEKGIRWAKDYEL